jgi:hypothetical protein
MAACLCTPEPARAQEFATSLHELRLLTNVGDRVTVNDRAGESTTGRISDLSGTSLTVEADGQTRQWREDEIATITRRHRDSLANGALWGLAVGAGLVTIAASLTYESNGNDAGWAAVAIGFYGAAGAGIGAGIDALIARRRTIFDRLPVSDGRVSAGVQVVPGGAAARIAVRF